MNSAGHLGGVEGWAVALGAGAAILAGGASAAADTGADSPSNISTTVSTTPSSISSSTSRSAQSGRAARRLPPAPNFRSVAQSHLRRHLQIAGRSAPTSAPEAPAVDALLLADVSASPKQQGASITVRAVDVTFGEMAVDGVIDAVSSRSLGLRYGVVSGPNQAGNLDLTPDGEFTLTPLPSAVIGRKTEEFAVSITEATALEDFLKRIPLLGDFVPQIFGALRKMPFVSDLLAPFIGSTLVKQISIDLGKLSPPVPEQPGPIQLPLHVSAGWNLYSWQASSPDVIDAVARQKPGLVRWFVEMDRFLEDENQPFSPSRTWSWDSETSFDPFFQALADQHTTLVVSLWNKDHWAKSMRACDTCAWPNIDAFAAFVDDLDDEAGKFGVNVIFEAQNEPDLRWGSLNAATNIGATENFTTAWNSGLPQGWAQYRGGAGELWQQMHDVIDAPFASGGIISEYTAEITLSQRLAGNYPRTVVSTRWIDMTAPLVDYASFHRYGLSNVSVEDYVDWVYDNWSIWNADKGYPMPFYIGEIGPSSTASTGFTNADAAKMRDINEALATDPRFEGAYLGMIAHVFSSGGAPNPWETSTGWWDPAFDVAEVVTREDTG